MRVAGNCTSFRAQHDRHFARFVNERQAQTSDTVKKNRSTVSVPLMVGVRAWVIGAMTSASLRISMRDRKLGYDRSSEETSICL